MSLINQVLQDLDRRHAGAGMPVTPLGVTAARHEPRGARWLVAVAIAAAAAALAVALTLSGAFAAVGGRVATAAPVPLASPLPAPSPPAPASIVASALVPASASVAATGPVGATASVGATAPAAATAPVAGAASVAALAPLTDAARMPAPTTTAANASFAEPVIIAPTAPIDRPTPATATIASTLRPHAAPRASASTGPNDANASAAERVAVTTTPQLDKRTPPASARERAETAYRRGLDAHRDGRDDAAETAFALALQEDARHAAARQALAVILAGRQRDDAAEALLVEGLALDAHQTVLATTLARIKAGRGDVAGAIAVLEGQDGAAAEGLRATLLQGAGRHREAIEHYALALQLAPANGAWWAAMSVSLAAVGRHDAAREALLRARASESTAPELLAWIEQRLRSGTHAATASN